MDFFNENLRCLLWEKDDERSRFVAPSQRIDVWLRRLNTWIGDEARAKALLLGESPQADELSCLAQVSGRDEETLRNGRLAADRNILTQNLCFLFGTVEHGQMSAVAERLGVNQSTIQRWRSGTKPGVDKRSAILAEFGLPATCDLDDEALFLSLAPIGLRQKQDWLKRRIDELDTHELNELFPALRRIFGDKK